jgi:hypothetical protein
MIASTPTHYDSDQGAVTEDYPRSRHAALASAVAGIRVRRGGRFNVEQILLAAAAVLFPLGLIFILLGWDGAAHNGHTYAQIDYLISGGIFGLGLSVAGGFMYFGYWLSRQLGESRRQNALTVQALERLEDLLDFAVNSRAHGDGAFAAPEKAEKAVPRRTYVQSTARRVSSAEAERPTGKVPAVGGSALFATPRGSLLHRPDCPVVARRSDLKVLRPGAEGYGYCTMCNSAASPA